MNSNVCTPVLQVLCAALCAMGFVGCRQLNTEPTVKVGILHSLSGTLSESETAVRDAELMAIEEINEKGGVLGRKIEIVEGDGESNPKVFGDLARKMLTEDHVATIFGCWSSAARKEVRSVVEQEDIYGLLWYPLQYEGLEASPNIMYMGAAPNQQIVPAVEYCAEHFGKRMFLIGSDYIFPQTANRIINALLPTVGGECVGEYYAPLDSLDFVAAVEQIKAVKPDVILNTLNGKSNKAFFSQLQAEGLSADEIPVMSFSVAEEEAGYIGADLLEGHYAVWNYFQTLQTDRNKMFVARFKNRYGNFRATDDPVEAGYIAVYVWARACEKAGSFGVEDVRMAAKGLAFDAPEGTVTIDGENQHLSKWVRIGKINGNGLIDEVWKSSDVVKPDPYLSTYSWARGLN
ncbi:MAG: urea ABC transporter substrate-binding protein [Treponema sp.]|nr:urea ABC transporter substrate-binding protein [Treponema sp.]